MLCIQTIDLTTWVCRFLSEIGQNTPFLTSFGQKTEDKLQYMCKNWGQNKVIIAKKSNFLQNIVQNPSPRLKVDGPHLYMNLEKCYL